MERSPDRLRRLGGSGARIPLALCGLAIGLAYGGVAALGRAPHASAQAASPHAGVPRYVSLRYETVNARTNPGRSEPLKWIYRGRGLPLQVIAQTADWRRVCDPDGGVAWVHRWNLSARRTVINSSPNAAPLYRRPGGGPQPRAYLGVRALADLDRCDAGWCRVRVGNTIGWVPSDQIWGVGEGPLCGAGPLVDPSLRPGARASPPAR